MNLRLKIQQIKTIASDGRYLRFFFQRRFAALKTRKSMGDRVAAHCPQPAYTNHLDQAASKQLGKSGIVHLGQLLSNEEVSEIRHWLEQRKIADPYQPGAAPFLPMDCVRPVGIHVGYHDASDILAAPHLLALANRPEILAIAEGFLGCKPMIGYLAAWWSFAANDGAQGPEMFHRDVDDWRFLKLFVYLSDVGQYEGPHIYVKGSADIEQLTKIRRYQDSEIEDAFGQDAIVVNTGKAGEGFLENTYGFHKGQPVEQGCRLMFQVVYTLRALPYAPKTPIGSLHEQDTMIVGSLDAYINQLYLS